MTTKPSSSPRDSTRKLAIQVDGLPVRLGDVVGQGGEGIVFAIEGQPSLVAKVYHRFPLSDDDVAKLEALVACRSPELDQVSAWPQAVLQDSYRQAPCGILMPKVTDARHLHELYGTFNRRRYFPEVKWHHLLLAARNVAAAFHSLHSADIVVGDVNQGNMLVDHQMRVRFIDCDSFQIRRNGGVFPCPVGTPHFTPPELQAKMLREVARTPNHDRFGMAILIFHLLFVGRHPFAGRYRGSTEMSIEKAIAERRFAFSRHKWETLTDPPPASLLLDDLPEELGELFEKTFRPADEQPERPEALRWVKCLESLIQNRKTCSLDASHVYFSELDSCPWCRVEEEGGPAFFLAGDTPAVVSKDRLAALDERVRLLKVQGFPELDSERLSIPEALPSQRPATRLRWSLCDVAAWVTAAAVFPCLASMFSLFSFIAGSAAALVGGGFLLFSPSARSRRKQVRLLSQRLAKVQEALSKRSQAILAHHRRRKKEYETSLREVRVECDHYQAEGAKVRDVLVAQRGNQKEQFLARHLLQDNIPRIPGLNSSMVSMLESFGVESALDVDKLKLTGIPVLSPSLAMELMVWREQVESRFNYKPDHGITFQQLKLAEEEAVRRFKIAQARRVLMGARQVDSLANAARYEFESELKKYDEFKARGNAAAEELRDFQSKRRPLERWINRSWVKILGVTLVGPLVGGVLYWLLG